MIAISNCTGSGPTIRAASSISASAPPGIVPKPQVPAMPAGDGNAARALKGIRNAYFADQRAFVECKVYDRLKLQNGDRLEGPAILEEPDSTTICPFGYSVSVDPLLNLLIKKDCNRCSPTGAPGLEVKTRSAKAL